MGVGLQGGMGYVWVKGGWGTSGVGYIWGKGGWGTSGGRGDGVRLEEGGMGLGPDK